MFDMGFTEMMLIGIVALVVIGPERLPGVARTAGKYFSRLRNFMMNVRADVESELKADELREMFEAQQKELQSLKEVVGDTGKDIGLSEINREISEVANSLDESPTKPAAEPITKVTPKAKSKPAAKKKSTAKSSTKPGKTSKLKAKPKAKSATAAAKKPQSAWASAITPPEDSTLADKSKSRPRAVKSKST